MPSRRTNTISMTQQSWRERKCSEERMRQPLFQRMLRNISWEFFYQKLPDMNTTSSLPIIHKATDRDCSIRDLIQRDSDASDLIAISTAPLAAETEAEEFSF